MSLYWTTAGVLPGRGEISRFDFKDRVKAAAKAGFRGIGIWHTDLEHILVHRTLKEMKQILDDNGMKYVELEFLTDWFLKGARKGESDSRKRRLLEASAALHAKHVKVGDFYNSICPMPQIIESFAALCTEAENYGATIGFELMNCAMIDNIPDALAMLEASTAKNAGLIIDIYQAVNLGMTFEQISRIPLKYLINVELNDGTLPGSPEYDPSKRRFCGDGDYDVKGFINCVRNLGYTGPWAVEVISEELAKMPIKEISKRAFSTTMAQFADQSPTFRSSFMKQAADNSNDLDRAIRQHRMKNATVALSHAGTPVANQEILLSQKKHKFLFGSNWGESSVALANGELSGKEKEQAELRSERFVEIFNQVTFPFYWARFEPQRGQPQTQRLLNAARWYLDHNCLIKGHPLCWHTLTADWLLKMNNRDILQAQLARIERDMTAFAGVIDQWDVVNEAVIMPVFDRYDNGITRLCKEMGRIELIRTMFNAARAANPKATLLLNDFDVSPAYDILVEGCLDAGVQIDAIGIQSHMHQGYWGVERTQMVLKNFARFNLPIHFTENTIVSGQLMPAEIVDLNDYQVSDWPSTAEGEQRQAREVVLHYKTLLANPSVQSITWWDLSDGGWLNAPAGLLHKDHSPKPAYDELLKLIKGEWWLAPTKLTTDANGQFVFEGFQGEYELSLGKQRTSFSLNEENEAIISVSI